jgi:cytoskeletal protein CcmA (bactofilin family)
MRLSKSSAIGLDGSIVQGSVSASDVSGAVQGEVESRGSVIVESDANVDAKITAQQLQIAGTVNGELSCTGRMEIQPSGRVTGEVSAGSLIMHEGAYFEGHLKMLKRSDEQSTMVGRAVVEESAPR